ncbi:MAG: hypothetical protein ABSF80_06795 [Chitinispirillaceae bacterium]|jgi:tetratricopeptide (TPR) repeat protein
MKAVVVLISSAILFPLTLLHAEDSYYTKENILKFAAYCYAQEDYERAIGEYLRVAALCRDPKLTDTLLYRIATACLHLSKTTLVRKYCAQIPVDTSDSLLAMKARCLGAYSYYAEKRYDSLLAVVADQETTIIDPVLKNRWIQMNIAAFIKTYRWDDAIAESEKALKRQGTEAEDSIVQYLYRISRDGKQLRLKSPWIAGTLSALVPGSGKVFAGRGWDGAYSFLLVGIMAWQAYEGYVKDGLASARCITFGLLGTAFYTGNIYGSVNAAVLCNRSRRAALAERANVRFDW